MENNIILIQDLKIVVEALANGSISMIDILSLINKTDKKNDEIILTIDYNRTLEDMIRVGNYDKRSLSVGDGFTIPSDLPGQKRFIHAKLFNFKPKIQSNDVISEMAKEGYFPANLIDLLYFGKDYIELQKFYRIVALGTVFSYTSGSYVPVINCFPSKRHLGSYPLNTEWDGLYKFLAVK